MRSKARQSRYYENSTWFLIRTSQLSSLSYRPDLLIGFAELM
jgi:hypothetical protein